MKQTWYVYMIYSLSTGRLYTGISTSPNTRLEKHNAGRGTKYTKQGRPWRIVWARMCESKGDALKLEILIKKMRRSERLVLTGLAA